MSAMLVGVILVLIIGAAIGLFARWRAARQERRERNLRESWAIYRASRALHDETANVLQKMMDEVRKSRPGGEA
jgi:hypothetical protein